MIRYLVLITIIIFGHLPSLNAQDIQMEICDSLWWQQATVEEIELLTLRNEFSNLRCNGSGDTPIMMAIRAGVSFDVLHAVFELIAYNAVAEALNTKNNFEETALMFLLEKSDDPTTHLDINVQIDLIGLSKADLLDQ